MNVVEDEGFVVMPFPFYEGNYVDPPPSWNATRLLSESV